MTSPISDDFKRRLPKELQDVAEVSFSYQLHWKIASDHLKKLYGEYADPQHCLDAYYNSPEYRDNRQMIRRCPDIPLITMDDIQKMLNEEEQYAETVRKLLTIFKEKDSDEKTNELAKLLGLFPHSDTNALFRYLISKDDIPENEIPIIIKNINAKKNLLFVITEILARTFISGSLLQFPAAGDVMTQPKSRYFYRGEHAYFRSSKASIYRQSNVDKPESVQALIDRLRLYQCWETLDRLDAVHHWGFSKPNYMALAQHYGFKTMMIDITSDLKTALFFACCKFGKDRKWHPLTNEDFAHRNSRPGISKRDGDSRYGVLFRSPTEITDLRWCIEPDGSANEIIIPVGYQPMMRCSQQHGYMMLTHSDYDLYRDKRFDKFKFRLTEDICNWIYKEMDQGNAVYPNDDIPDISPEIEALNNNTTFSQEVFTNATEILNLKPEDVMNLKAVLKDYGITIVETVDTIAPEKLDKINQEYSAQYVMEKMGILPQIYPMVHLPHDVEII